MRFAEIGCLDSKLRAMNRVWHTVYGAQQDTKS